MPSSSPWHSAIAVTPITPTAASRCCSTQRTPSGNTVDAAKMKVVKNEAFTSTAGTQDANIEFHTSENGTLGKKIEILSSVRKSLVTWRSPAT